jgi:DNA-binding transcriptional LysR family regulator
VRCNFSAGFAQALADGELDVAVHALASPPPAARVLKREKTVWVASRQHRVYRQEPLPIALFDRACWWRDIALQSLDARGGDYREVFSSESAAGIAAAVASGVAVALLGEDSCDSRFLRLGPQQGFPTTPDSFLVLQLCEGVDSELSRAMCRLIEGSFAHQHS